MTEQYFCNCNVNNFSIFRYSKTKEGTYYLCCNKCDKIITIIIHHKHRSKLK